MDPIDRQAALDAFNDKIDLPNDERVMKSVESYLQRICNKIKSLSSAQPEEVFEIGKPHPLKGYEFCIFKDAYGDDWVEIRKYQEPWRGEDNAN